MDRGVFFALVNFAALALVAALMVALLSPFLPSLVWGAVLAFAAFPLYRRFLRWTRGRRNIAAGLATAAVVLLVAAPLVLAAMSLAQQSAALMSRAQEAAQNGALPGKEQLMSRPEVAGLIKKVEPYLRGVDLKQALLAGTKALSGAAIDLSTRVFKNAAVFLFQFAAMIFVIFFAFRDGETATENFWAVVPLRAQDKDKLKDLLQRVVQAVLFGVVLACLLQGVLGGIGFVVVGLPAPVFFGALMALCAFIPVVGSGLVWLPATLYLLAEGRYGAALFMGLWGGVLVSWIDNIFRPLFISGKSRISIFVVALGVLGGLITFGFLGVVVGPLLFATALELFRIYREGIFPGREQVAGAEAPAEQGEPFA